MQNLSQTAELTQDNLAAYHDALVLATKEAAREGRFDRRSSNDKSDSPVVVSGRQRVSFKDEPTSDNAATGMDRALAEPSDPGTLDDLDQDDDAIIAAANAEALENDDEGIYGQEFNFYASAGGEAQYANGGYFGEPGPGPGIKRSHSGRANGQEPSLTPITERSEWSQRTSMISLAMHGGLAPAPAPPQPGLAQLADAIQHEDESAHSLHALLRLRRGWGGSDVSLAGSSAAPSFKSPPPPMQAPPPPPYTLAFPAGPAPAAAVAPPRTAPPTAAPFDPADPDRTPVPAPPQRLSLQTADLGKALPLPPPRSAGSDGSPIKRSHAVKGSSSGGGCAGHSRTSSGAESISYVRESDEDGGRWVMEKRRTGESGVMEVLGREVLEVGRI